MKLQRMFTRFAKPVLALVAGLAVMFSLVSCRKAEETVKQEAAYIIGMDEYVYGFPLVIMDATRQVVTAVPKAGEYYAPINQFLKIRSYVDPDYKVVVRISRNTLLSGGVMDAGTEPMIVSVPDCKDIPVAVRFLNHWTDVFATTGSRTGEPYAGNYLVVGPDWNGAAPADIKKVVRSSTRYAWVIIEMAANSPRDFPKIHALQDQLKITPLSAWGKPYTPPSNVPIDPTVDRTATPYDQVRLMTGEMFFKKLAALLKDNPPYPADAKMLERLKRIGVEPGKEFDPSKLDPGIRKGIDEAPAEVWKKFVTGPFEMNAPNGWLNMLNIARFGTDYEIRAFVAYFGLLAGVKEDIVYPSAMVDGNGWALDGSHKYIMHWDKADLALSQDGVWSISQYRENFYVHNPLNRYQLGSNTPLKYNPDGSLDMYIQANSPGPDKEDNWLPLPPSGMVNLTVRIYNPKPEAFNPSHKFPPVQRVD
jgi:hypothetical protein